LRSLAAGRALIVNDHGWYSELPDNVCCKVPVQDDEALYRVMLRLAQDPDFRSHLGRQAVAVIAENNTGERSAESYMGLVSSLLGD
jgi:glycosyltransferase involved in cell wall biosynthesis